MGKRDADIDPYYDNARIRENEALRQRFDYECRGMEHDELVSVSQYQLLSRLRNSIKPTK